MNMNMGEIFSSSILNEFRKNSINPAIYYRHQGKYHEIKYNELLKRITEFSAGLMKSGACKGDKLVIVNRNSPEWLTADFACLFTGIIDVPLYRNISNEHIKYIIKQISPEFFLVSDYGILKKILSFSAESLKNALFIVDETEKTPDDKIFDKYRIVSFYDVIDSGKSEIGEGKFELSTHISSLSGDDTATIIYTSGTTGTPKGVTITQNNILAEIIGLDGAIETAEGDSIVSFLPLSHVFARLVDYFLLFNGRAIYYPDKPEALSRNLIEVKPTLLVGVPRVFDKIYSSVMEECSSGNKRKLLEWCLKNSGKYFELRKESKKISTVIAVKRYFAEKLFFSRIKKKLGGRLKILISGGAPLSKDVAGFFENIGLTIQEGYGLTETCCAVTLNRKDSEKKGTVGQPLSCAEIRISETGEILVKGAMVMKGYFNDKDSTDEVIDQEGWFHTGDAGCLDNDNYLTITDRIKELIKTSSGKYVAPQRLESFLVHNMSVANAIIIGDREKFITSLIVPEREVITKMIHKTDISDDEYKSIIAKDDINDFFRKVIADTNSKLESHEKIKNFRLIAEDFSIETGDLTPTFKLKRRFIIEKNKKLINEMYKEI